MSTSTRSHLGLACLVALSIGAGACNLYFGPNNGGGDHWTYCDQTGCYDCTGNTCTPQGGAGYTCSSSDQCAAGCYCSLPGANNTSNGSGSSSGTCVESGFCTSTSCPSGFHCDGRSTCVPDGQPSGCTSSTDCASGSYCDTLSGTCQPTTTCGADGSCPAGYQCDSRGTCVPVNCTDNTMCASGCYCDTTSGDPNYGQCVETGYCTADNQCPSGYYCDETRSTCLPGTDPNQPSCAGTISTSCTTGQPQCQPDQVPTILNGCWTGQCEAISSCDAAPSCGVINTETSCAARSDCKVEKTGHNCHHSDGSACSGANDPLCTCDSYTFADCTTK
jgi:hypothetical protein